MILLEVLCCFCIFSSRPVRAVFFYHGMFTNEIHYYSYASWRPFIQEIKVNFSQLDIRVGKILSIETHPTNERLYIGKVDLNESTPRTTVTGMRPYVPIDEMKNRLSLFVCNLKPFLLDNVTNNAYILAGNDGRKIELISVPKDCVPGDIAYVPGFEYNPLSQIEDDAMFTALIRKLIVNEFKRVTYRDTPPSTFRENHGVPLNISGKGWPFATELGICTLC